VSGSERWQHEAAPELEFDGREGVGDWLQEHG
jgi:hypothetical protein